MTEKIRNFIFLLAFSVISLGTKWRVNGMSIFCCLVQVVSFCCNSYIEIMALNFMCYIENENDGLSGKLVVLLRLLRQRTLLS